MNLLFLGDSITDCDHCFTKDNLGNGYVKYIASALPDACITNGGTDGFTFQRLFRKWQDMYRVSSYYNTAVILCGVNDAAVLSDTGMNQPQAEQFLSDCEASLRSLLQGLIRSEVSQILLIEPFLFPEYAWTHAWKPALDQIIQMIRRTAASVSQAALSPDIIRILSFDTAAVSSLPDADMQLYSHEAAQASLSFDGVHLTAKGHERLAQLILQNLTES